MYFGNILLKQVNCIANSLAMYEAQLTRSYFNTKQLYVMEVHKKNTSVDETSFTSLRTGCY